METHGNPLCEIESRSSEISSIPANNAGLAKPSTQTNISRRQLTRQEELALKPVVQRLYIEEGLTFAEVQRVLQTDYNFYPTKRQFATLQAKWGFKKNTRVIDRQRLLEKVNSGDLSEEGSVGTVSLNVEKIRRWRREVVDRTVSVKRSSSQVIDGNFTHNSYLAHDNLMAEDPFSQPVTVDSGIVQYLQSPGRFRMTEGLIFSISSYVAGMYDQKIWLPVVYSAGEVGPLQDKYTVTEAFQQLNRFYGGCASAMELIKKESFVEARRVLSLACSSIRSILESHHPDTLRYLIASFYQFLRDGSRHLDDALTILRNYIARMASIVLPQNHPWRIICQLLGTLDQAQLEQTLLMSLELVADIYKSKLGLYHEVTSETQTLCFEWRYRHNLIDGERAIRHLLNNFPSRTSDFGSNFQLRKALANNLSHQGRVEELESLANETAIDTRAHGTYFQLMIALQIRGNAEKMLGKYPQAFASKREVVDMHLSRNDSESLTWAILHLSKLESWTREWGWIAESDAIKAEVESLIARDTVGAEDSLEDSEA